MLEASAAQGIGRVAATPHFYPAETSPERFLARRDAALEKLLAAWRPGLPELLLGAEVYYFEGMGRAEAMDALRLEGTELLLLEMPFETWTERMVAEVLSLQHRGGIRVLMAHIERYIRFQKKDVWDILLEEGVLMQCNASFFLQWNTRRKARRMLEEGRIHLLGSDCHNMGPRPPRMGEALAAIGVSGRQRLEWNDKHLVPGAEREAIY